MIDTPEPRYWEPRTFAVGDRVRVRLSPECRNTFGHQMGDRIAPTRTRGHVIEEDGKTGTIQTIRDSKSGHCFRVYFDIPFSCAEEPDYGQLIGGDYAAVELEPLEEPCPAS